MLLSTHQESFLFPNALTDLICRRGAVESTAARSISSEMPLEPGTRPLGSLFMAVMTTSHGLTQGGRVERDTVIRRAQTKEGQLCIEVGGGGVLREHGCIVETNEPVSTRALGYGSHRQREGIGPSDTASFTNCTEGFISGTEIVFLELQFSLVINPIHPGSVVTA